MQQISWKVMKMYPSKIVEIIILGFLLISYVTRKLRVLREIGPWFALQYIFSDRYCVSLLTYYLDIIGSLVP